MTMTANGLAKLIEECGELMQIAGKKLAYFHTDEHPDGAGSLQSRLEEAIADVQAATILVVESMGLDKKRIATRFVNKVEQFDRWERNTSNNTHGVDNPNQRNGKRR
jgi:NTP pyrophosphatase (non-canonical NTP hydrolase)